MNDGIIKDDGTSRLVRSVSNFKEKYPTYDDFAEALVAGTLPLDVLFNADGWSQQPDFLNKANLLKDATAALFQLSGDTALPDRVFEILSKAALVGEDGGLVTADGKKYKTPIIEFTGYTGTGTGGPSYPCSISFSFKPDIVFYYASTSGDESIIYPTFYASNEKVYLISIEKYTDLFESRRGFCTSNNVESYELNYGKFEDETNTLSWYNNSEYEPDRKRNQLNALGTKYLFVGMKGI